MYATIALYAIDVTNSTICKFIVVTFTIVTIVVCITIALDATNVTNITIVANSTNVIY